MRIPPTLTPGQPVRLRPRPSRLCPGHVHRGGEATIYRVLVDRHGPAYAVIITYTQAVRMARLEHLEIHRQTPPKRKRQRT